MSVHSADVSSHDRHGNETLAHRYTVVRKQSEYLCEPLEVEDYCVQSMDDASPIKWHLAHVTWFFETFVLKELLPDYKPFHALFEHLFNSYYNGVGRPFPRPNRGDLSRPTVKEVYAYRAAVDAAMLSVLEQEPPQEMMDRIVLGLNHEQQHQELILTDLKHHFAQNPLFPVYRPSNQALQTASAREVGAIDFQSFDGGVIEVGADVGFSFDNERPRHSVLLQPFAFADRLVTNGEFLQFVLDGGYRSSHLWLSEGWSTVEAENWQHPGYWVSRDGEWFEFRLDGLHRLDLNAPAVHVSAHEAFAFASWMGARLPTEFEWEHVASGYDPNQAPSHCFVESALFHPRGAVPGEQEDEEKRKMRELFGQVWQWTSSSYGPYPGYKTLPGTLGEYNGKFMSSQLVLRGGSVATPKNHFRISYRNFFYPPDRWQFTGIRLAKDV